MSDEGGRFEGGALTAAAEGAGKGGGIVDGTTVVAASGGGNDEKASTTVSNSPRESGAGDDDGGGNDDGPVDPDEDTYVYRDFSTVPAPNNMPSTNMATLHHPQSLQAQKLPAKLATMLVDQGE